MLECSTVKDTGTTANWTTVVCVSRFSEILHKAQAGPLGEARLVGKGRGGVVTLHGCVRESISTVGTLSTIYTREDANRFRFCGQFLGNFGEFLIGCTMSNQSLCAANLTPPSWFETSRRRHQSGCRYSPPTCGLSLLSPARRTGRDARDLSIRQLLTVRSRCLNDAQAQTGPGHTMPTGTGGIISGSLTPSRLETFPERTPKET